MIDLSLIKSMGVINITPNSFSDGDEFNTVERFSKRFEELLSWADIIDIGAESTAPFNKPISFEEELKRFKDIFFPYVLSNPDPLTTISIDTYKIDVFKEIASFLHNLWPKTKLIFNDVSGCIDDELVKLLGSFEIPFSYVYCHNLVPRRELTSEHMSYTDSNSDFYENLCQFFQSGLKKLYKFNVPVVLDPCFGFSKTRDQNHYLLKRMDEFFSSLDFNGFVFYGISRKSFLRFPKDLDPKLSDSQNYLDSIQTLLLYDLIKKSHQKLIFRLHDESSLKALEAFGQIKGITLD